MTLQSAIREGLDAGLKKAAPGMVQTVLDAVWNHPAFPILMGMQGRFMDAGMKPAEAWKLARTTLADYLAEEKIKVGDPRFSWKPADGRDLAVELEIEHWETQP